MPPRYSADAARCGWGTSVSYFPGSEFLVALWRRDIVKARIELVADGLSSQRRDALWWAIDCREWFIRMVADDFHAEMETIDRMLETELRR